MLRIFSLLILLAPLSAWSHLIEETLQIGDKKTRIIIQNIPSFEIQVVATGAKSLSKPLSTQDFHKIQREVLQLIQNSQNGTFCKTTFLNMSLESPKKEGHFCLERNTTDASKQALQHFQGLYNWARLP